jgi:hypothetical protein
LVEENGYGFGLDLGILYQATSNWKAGIKINDAFTTQIIWSDSDNEVVTPSADFETSYQFDFNKAGCRAIRIIGMAEVITDFAEDSITTQIGDLGLDFHAGLEYVADRNLSLLFGYDIDNLTAGLSISISRYMISYAYEHEMNDDLDNSHRISAGLRF